METITGFANWSSIGEGFNFQSNDALTAVPAFDALASVGGSLIQNNGALTAIPTFSTIKTTESISISRNGALTAISGFDRAHPHHVFGVLFISLMTSWRLFQDLMPLKVSKHFSLLTGIPN